VQNCAASTALAPLGFLGLPLWPLDFCRYGWDDHFALHLLLSSGPLPHEEAARESVLHGTSVTHCSRYNHTISGVSDRCYMHCAGQVSVLLCLALNVASEHLWSLPLRQGCHLLARVACLVLLTIIMDHAVWHTLHCSTCRAPTLANGLVETATISIAMCSVFLPPSDLQLLADLVAGRLLTEGIPASAEAPVRSTTCPRTCLPSDAPPRQLLATNSTDNSDSHGVNANFMVGGGNAVPRANSSSAFQNQVAGAVSTSDSVVASSPVASVIDTSGSPTTGSSVCSLHPVTRALAQTLVEVGRVVIPGPGATWLARGGLGVDRQTSWYGVQFTQVGRL
jgi:hypothetical protein